MISNGIESNNSTKPNHSMQSFVFIWTGQAVSLIGSRLVRFALIWWLTIQTGSATLLAVAMIMMFLPQVIITPFAGPLVDRWSRRKTMIAADSLTALTVAVIAFLFALEIVEYWQVFIMMFLGATLGAFHWPAMQAATTLLVPEKHLSRIGGMNQGLMGIANIVAPPMGAVLLGFLPMQFILSIDIATAFLAVPLLFFVKIPQPSRENHTEETSVMSEMKEGFRYLRNWPGAFMVVCFAMILNLFSMPAFSLLPIMTVNHFGGDEVILAELQAAQAVGMVIGAFILGIWGGFKQRIKTAMSALIIVGSGMLLIGLTPPDAVNFATLMMFVVGVFNPIVNGSIIAVLQSTIPPDMQGRVFSLVISGISAMAPVGLTIAGPLADAFGVPIWFVISGLVTTSVAITAFFVPAVMNIETQNGGVKETSVVERSENLLATANQD
jgi:DHA3 family macrolide efflux protein-like MFS transporter